MANAIGPELLAHFALAQIYVGIINSIFNVQTWESMIKFGAQDSNTENFLASTIKTNFIIDLVSALIALAFAIMLLPVTASLLKWPPELIELAYLYSLTIPFTLTTLTIGIPRLFNKFFDIAKIQFSIAALRLLAVFYISQIDGNTKQYISIYIAGEILLNLCLIFLSTVLIRKKDDLHFLKAKITINRDQIKFLWWTNLRTIVRIPVRHLDMIIISQVMSMNTVGVYKVYKEIASIIDRLGVPVNQALYPEYAKLLGKEKSDDSINITKKIILLLSLISILTLGFFLVFSELIVGKLFGVEYLTLITALYFLVVLTCINLALTPINSLFIAAGFAKYGFYIVLANNILYLAAALIGGTYLGIYGIILAFAAQMTFNQGAKILMMKKFS